jgi:MFS family permease
VLFLLLFASAAASPLYRVYRAQWRFSATTLTVVFGDYALTLLVTLLVFGSLSDYVGRRRVIAVALAAGAGACELFLAAHGVGLLFAARARRAPPSAFTCPWARRLPRRCSALTGPGVGRPGDLPDRRDGCRPTAMLADCLALLAGAVMTLAAIETASAAAFLAGGAVAGAGVGTGFFAGAYRILTALAGPSQRAGLVAAIWTVFYLAFGVPVVAAGVATTHFGLHDTAVGYSAGLAVLSAAAAGIFLFYRRSLHREAGPAAQTGRTADTQRRGR